MILEKNINIIAKSTLLLATLCLLFFSITNFSHALDVSPVHRFYSTKYKSHLYTSSDKEKDNIIKNWPTDIWAYQTIEFYAYDSLSTNLIPVHRFWSKKYRTLYYTTSDAEKDNIIKNWPTYTWEYQGVKFYVAKKQSDDLVPVFKFWSPKYKSSYFTTSTGQKDCMIESYSNDIWRFEGIVWWVPKEGANLKTKVTTCGGYFGPNITIGLQEYSRSELRDSAFKIDSTRDYVIKDKDGNKITTVKSGTQTKVKYDSDGNLKIYNSISDKIINKEVRFEATDGYNTSIVFNIHKPNSSFDEYRGKIKLRYSDSSKNIWVINELPLEQYIWGMGEITGTGPMEYNKMMTTTYRTYGYWKILYSTKYATEGFKVNATPGNQLYYGYEWEKRYPRIKQGAEATRGKIAKHDSDVALTPYSSWTDGRTRSFEERWGSTSYPWCQSVKDSYGKHPTMSTSELVASGNHMVGISAHGALNLADDHGWNWDKIIKYYLTGINIVSIY